MAALNSVFMQTVPGDAINGTSAGTDTLLIRGGIFLICLAIFVFGCGLAWRKIPALRALIPAFQPGESSLEARMAEKKKQRESEALALAETAQADPPVANRIAPPDLSKRPFTANSTRPISLVPLPKPEPEALPLANELASSDKRIAAALADGTPGALIHSASDLDGSIHHAPIMIVQREDETPES